MNKLQAFFDGIENIGWKNHGGCLFFCYTFWLWLKKNNMSTESFEIVQYDAAYEKGANIAINQVWIDEQSGNAASAAHFTWMYEGEEYDAEGPFSTLRPDDIKAILKGLNTPNAELVEEFCKNALTKATWNYMFNRVGAIPVVEQAFGIIIAKGI
jgi:hypothetical protein